MPSYSMQVTIFPTSNLAADASVNTWSFDADDVLAAEDARDAIIALYGSLVTLYPATVRQNNHLYKIYDRQDAPPRVPVLEGPWSFPSTPTGAPLPPEVALCLSFQGTPESGVSQARKRGRVYLGPIDQQFCDTDGRPTAGVITTILNAGDTLYDASVAAADWTWTVYSATTADSFPVANGWVDNEFDTQRRRGRLATSRSVFP